MNKQAQIEAHYERVQRRVWNTLHDKVYALEDEDDYSIYGMFTRLRRTARERGEQTWLSWRARTPEGETESDRFNLLGEDTGRDLAAWQREEEDEDLAYDLLTELCDLDAQIAGGLVIEDEQHHLTITPDGWRMAHAQAASIVKALRQVGVKK